MLFLCAILAPIAGAGVYNEFRVRSERVLEVRTDALRMAQLVHSDVVNIVQGTRNLLIATATSPSIRELDGERCTARLTDLRNKFDRYVSLLVTDWDGNVVCSSGNRMPPGQIKDQPNLGAARNSADLAVGHYTVMHGAEWPVLPIAYPFHGNDGAWAGIIVATLNLRWLSQHLAEIPDTEQAVITVADRDGIVLARNVEATRYIGQPFRAAARQSGGTVSLDSEPDNGTSITTYLPRATGVASIAASQTLALEPAGDGGRRRVLLVDDDPNVRITVAGMLRRLDHAVHEFASGAAALDHLAQDPGYDVLITDLAMPEMNGTTLANRASELVPGLKVLLITGFATGQEDAAPSWPSLRKPFKTADLAAALRDLNEASAVPLARRA